MSNDQEPKAESSGEVSRRDFVTLSLAAGIALAAGAPSEAAFPATSPHLRAPKIRARMYFGVASNDDMRQPDATEKLKEAFAAAKVPAEIEVYPSLHGWCVPDMPLQNGSPIYNKPDAERA